MQTIKLKRGSIDIIDDIGDRNGLMNVHNFFMELAIENGIEPSPEGISSHLEKLSQFIQNDKKEEAIQELNNMTASFYAMFNNIDPAGNAFCHLVARVGNKTFSNHNKVTIENIKQAINDLGGISRNDLKKKSMK